MILSAKSLNPGLTVVTRASEEEAEVKLRRAGADIVFTPYAMVGQRLAQSLVKPQVIEFLTMTMTDMGPNVMLEQTMLGQKSQLASKTFGEIQQHCPSGSYSVGDSPFRRPDGFQSCTRHFGLGRGLPDCYWRKARSGEAGPLAG